MYHSIGLLLLVVVAAANAYGYLDENQYVEDGDPLLKISELVKRLGDGGAYDDLLDDQRSLPLDVRADGNYFMPYVPFSDDYATIARPRDIEVAENHGLTGSKSISGGTGRNMQISKSDKVLPSYCNPPNPCPKGKTKKDNCLTADEFKNTAEENEKYNARQKCACDEEHMRSCNRKSTINSKTAENESASQMLLGELKDEGLLLNPYTTGEKRQTLVAKKSPGMNRKKRSLEFSNEMGTNAKFDNAKLKRVAKKSPELIME